DAGVIRSIDQCERAWLRAALDSARGKFTMAILGHPLYAGGHYLADGDEEFTALHQLLREHDVAIVVAGDTHGLEFYVEPRRGARGRITHMVNGGGGAYLSSAPRSTGRPCPRPTPGRSIRPPLRSPRRSARPFRPGRRPSGGGPSTSRLGRTRSSGCPPRST